MHLTLEEMPMEDRAKDIEDFEKTFGRRIITPRYYLQKDEKGDLIMSKEEWILRARCLCDCGCEVSLKHHGTHKKSKKHKDLMEKQCKKED